MCDENIKNLSRIARRIAREQDLENLRDGRVRRAAKMDKPKKGKGSYSRKEKYKKGDTHE